MNKSFDLWGNEPEAKVEAGAWVFETMKLKANPKLRPQMLLLREASAAWTTYIHGSHHQGKSGENISFWKLREFHYFFFFVESQGNHGILIWLRLTKVVIYHMPYLSDLYHEVRESQGEWPRKVRESQGILNRADRWEPYKHHLCATVLNVVLEY